MTLEGREQTPDGTPWWVLAMVLWGGGALFGALLALVLRRRRPTWQGGVRHLSSRT